METVTIIGGGLAGTECAFQLARQMNEPGGNHDIANLCYSRIHTLREKKRASAPPAGLPAPSRDDRAALLPPVRDDRPGMVRPASAPDRTPPPADPQDNRPQVGEQALVGRHWLSRDMTVNPLHGIGCHKGKTADEHFIQRDAE